MPLVRGQTSTARGPRTPAPLYTVYSPRIWTAMRKVINQRCPNRCLATCSSTVVTLTQVVPLVLYTVQFFLSHVWATHSASLPLSFAHVTCSLPICSVHFKRYTSIILFSKFNFQISNNKIQKNFVGHGHGQGSAPILFLCRKNVCIL